MTATTRQPYQFRLPMDYTDGSQLVVLHDIAIEEGRQVKVVGDPDNGSYEWVVEDGETLTFSNSGYGQSNIALRDGLIVYHGDYGSDECLASKITQLSKTSKTMHRRTVSPRTPR